MTPFIVLESIQNQYINGMHVYLTLNNWNYVLVLEFANNFCR